MLDADADRADLELRLIKPLLRDRAPLHPLVGSGGSWRKADIRRSVRSEASFAEPQAARAAALRAIVPLLQSGVVADALRCLIEIRPFGRVVLKIKQALMRGEALNFSDYRMQQDFMA